jgi:fatty-acyl-CoA synthase
MAKAQLQPWEVGLGKGRDHLARLAALVGVLTPLWLALAALGTKWGWWDWRAGLQQVPLNMLAMVFVIALCSLYAVLVVRPWGGRLLTAVGFLAPIVSAGAIFAVFAAPGMAKPPIHDINTDPAAAVQPSPALLAARKDAANPIDSPLAKALPDSPRFRQWAGKTVAAAQGEAYPDIAPVILAVPPAEAFQKAEALVRARGWTIVTADAATGSIEATAETFWYGFKDDVLIRVTADGAGSRIDIRSVSRVGLSDLGANAARVEALMADLKA